MTRDFLAENKIVKMVGSGLGEGHHGDALAHGKHHGLLIRVRVSRSFGGEG